MSTTTAVPPAALAGTAQPSRLRKPSFRFLLLLPAILYLVAMTQAPFVLTLWYSFHKWILTSPELGQGWVGLENYTYTVIEDPTFRDAVVNTLVMTVAIVGGSLVLGLAIALLLNRRFPLRGLVRALLIAPFFVMPTVNAVVWKNLLLNPVFGLLNWVGTSLGFVRIDWLAVAPKVSIIVMAVWQWTPFMMLILLAGLQGLSDEVREAAHVDGATSLAEFRFITLPLLGRYIELAVLLGTIYVLQIFGEIFVATQGGPGTATTTVPYYVYQTISQSNDVGSSTAQGVLAVLFASIIAALLLRLLTNTFRRSVQ
ncbi:MAG TPA: sugar ABC transporter permease [Chloroflexota bacterium]|nr:sugar ABC transporter permease [Chloroflexota bacterium]